MKIRKLIIGMLLLTILAPNAAVVAETVTPDADTVAPYCDLLPDQK